MSFKKTSKRAKGWKKLWAFLWKLTRNKLIIALLHLVPTVIEIIKEHHNLPH